MTYKQIIARRHHNGEMELVDAYGDTAMVSFGFGEFEVDFRRWPTGIRSMQPKRYCMLERRNSTPP